MWSIRKPNFEILSIEQKFIGSFSRACSSVGERPLCIKLAGGLGFNPQPVHFCWLIGFKIDMIRSLILLDRLSEIAVDICF